MGTIKRTSHKGRRGVSLDRPEIPIDNNPLDTLINNKGLM